jgi:hypothetical protein
MTSLKGYDRWLTTEPDYGDEPPVEDDGREAWRDAMLAKIKTWTDNFAPAAFRWRACVGDYDLGAKIGSGATENEAIEDLLDQLEPS